MATQMKLRDDNEGLSEEAESARRDFAEQVAAAKTRGSLVDAIRASAKSEHLYATLSEERGALTMAACHAHAARILDELWQREQRKAA